MEAPQPFRILPHLLQQAAYQVIVEEVFGLQEVTRPSQNSPEPNCPNSQNSVRKRTGGPWEESANQGPTRRFLIFGKGQTPGGTRLPGSARARPAPRRSATNTRKPSHFSYS